MNNDQLDGLTDDLERALQRDDPSFAKSFTALERSDRRNDVTVFSLLVGSAVLLATALATQWVAAGCGGVAAYLGPFPVDHRDHRKLTRSSNEDRTR